MRFDIRKYVIIVFIVLGTITVVFAAIVGKWISSGEFGRVEIRLQNGSKVYAVRQARGLSSETLAFTRNPDGCVPADPAFDYVIGNPSYTSVLYSVTNDGLTIFDYPIGHMVREPDNPWTDIKVNLSRSRNPLYQEVHTEPTKYGAILTQIPLNQTCWRNLFRGSR